MATPSLDAHQPGATELHRVALVGNPNAGKTALFNALTGLRAKTANYPGITVDVRKGRARAADLSIEFMDLPGLYSLEALTPEEKLTAAVLAGEFSGEPQPDVIVLVLDATNLQRHLFLASEILDLRLPLLVVLNLIDAAEADGITIDAEQLSAQLKCPVVRTSARTGAGLDELRKTLGQMLTQQLPVLNSNEHVSCTAGCTGCNFAARYDWAGELASRTVTHQQARISRRMEGIDRILTQPAVGVAAFLAVMLCVFYLIFSLAGIPMAAVEAGFGLLAAAVDAWLPINLPSDWAWRVTAGILTLVTIVAGYGAARIRWNRVSTTIAVAGTMVAALLPREDFRSLLLDGVIGGVGGMLVFLPQICILFFFIALLEDSGYMARAAFVMERLMRRVGLPGKAFVPMLSAHACAIPGIMATRVIENWRDRLVTILVLPLLTCSARLPVYGMVAALLFGDSTAMAALIFLAAYLLGIVAALATAFCLKLTLLKGETAPLVLELPTYRLPSLRNALLTAYDRAMVFVRRAGTLILLISVVLWTLVSYPKLPNGADVGFVAGRAEQEQVAEQAGNVSAEAPLAQRQLAYSWAGRMGRAVEPVFRPLGFDWKINVGVISSFAAREVIVATLAIIYGIGEEGADDEAKLTDVLRRQQHPDGRPVYSRATCLSLLVFYVLAMQCLPTQAVTRRETGSWGWAIFQLAYMSVLAYCAALLTYQTCLALGLT